ncbi:hypothetical protein CRUP_012957, partial [Coryphaenoides rupestris]
MMQRYSSLSGRLLMVDLEKGPGGPGLGLSLAGHRDGSRARMSVYVAQVDPRGAAGTDGRIRPGDELLEVLYGRSHQNASTLISNAPAKVNIILIRNEASLSQMDHGAKAEDLVDSRVHVPEPGGPYKDILRLILPQVSSMIKRQRASVKLSLDRAPPPPSSASAAASSLFSSSTSTSLTLPTASPSPRSLSPLPAPPSFFCPTTRPCPCLSLASSLHGARTSSPAAGPSDQAP